MKKAKTMLLISIVVFSFAYILSAVVPTFSKYNSRITDTINLTISKPQYKISFDANGGTGTMPDMTVKYGDTVNLDGNEYTRDLYTFNGWNTTSEGTGVPYADGASVSNLSSVNNAIITLYAQWDPVPVKYTVKHMLMNLDGTTYEEGDTIEAYEKHGTTVYPETREYTGFITPQVQSLVVNSNGQSVLTYYYAREQHRLTVGHEELLDSNESNLTGDYYYGATLKLKWQGDDGYEFIKWSNGETTEEIELTMGTSDIFIEPIYTSGTAVFKSYDGDNNLLGFSKSGITSFQRNKTLDLEEVLAKDGVTLISNTVNDGYKSEKAVYGWIEDNVLYWWSEATTVYFHPETIKGFYNISTLETIYLTGTSTSLVQNFSRWFGNNNALTHIYGKINTSGLVLDYGTFDYANDTVDTTCSNKGMSFMFNDDRNLQSIDLSEFDTRNAADMKRMFAGCNSLTSLDLSGFDTSNVKSMFWMFRKTTSMTEIDLSSFNTEKVENMLGMFTQSTAYKTIKLGNSFDTTNVQNMKYMFYGMNKLETIYAGSDFVRQPGIDSTQMFYNDTKLIGAKDETYETKFTAVKAAVTAIDPNDTSYMENDYAQIANEFQQGYFTLYSGNTVYTITYNLDGGSATNPPTYTANTPTFTLNNPTKVGYNFTGWTEGDSQTLLETVTIETGSVGHKEFTAHYTPKQYQIIFDANGGTGTMDNQTMTYGQTTQLTPNAYTFEGKVFDSWNDRADGLGNRYTNEQSVTSLSTGAPVTLYAQWVDDPFPVVFSMNGTCHFNGADGNITGDNCGDYSDKNYIPTGLNLFDTDTFDKDFEIYVEISNYTPNQQQSGVGQQTFINSFQEGQSRNLGIVLRRSGDKIELKARSQNSEKTANFNYGTVQNIRIIRKDHVIYYSLNGGALTELISFKNTTTRFNLETWFGAAQDSTGAVWRMVKCDMSNITIKLGTIPDE